VSSVNIVVGATMKRDVQNGDIVIDNGYAGAYTITKVGGERIGASHDRRDAMRQACAAAGATKARVWISPEDREPHMYGEVICP
jgi:hypothetical protein